MSQSTRIRLAIESEETSTSLSLGAQVGRLLHQFLAEFDLTNGTSSGQSDLVWSVRTQSITSGSPVDLDLRGALTSRLDGTAVSPVEIVALVLRNNSVTIGQNLLVGAGSNPVVSLWLATGDGEIIGPSGVSVKVNPIDGFVTIAATGDILRLAASTGTLTADVLIVGRSV